MYGNWIAKEFGVETTGDGQHGVAYGLSLQTADGGLVKEDVFGVGVGEINEAEIRVGSGRLAIGFREDDLPNELFLRPLVFDQRGSE